ncbi:tRNA lysidine(34) synthetase TilS [Lachnoclostridium sp.]|uniref:tRNA lysidine(34) synthetase TilS n=1 Tax=Lachnoclostridium sp. TaxID=2028282 RepID=UPI00289EEEDA|nr:tRNA lysidine(34) synthetase TilS [Lachnoclostridium sp.]
MLKKVENFIKEQGMLSPFDTVIIGVSGGADSICLLTCLHRLREQYHLNLYAVHVNHMLRGMEADEDEAFVRTMCNSLSIPLHCVREDVKRIAELSGTTIEEAGRNLRYLSFEQECERVKAHKIAVAHNRNDNAETVLFHLFRGTGLTGMTGIPKKRGQIIRPLLCVTRGEIETFLTHEHIFYRIDSTNLSNDYTRNKIRLSILPIATNEINERAIEHITSLSDQLLEVANYLEQVTAREFKRIATVSEAKVTLDVREFSTFEDLIKREVLRKAIKSISGLKDIESIHLVDGVNLCKCQVGKEIHLPNHIIVKRGYNTIIVYDSQKYSDRNDMVKNDLLVDIPLTIKKEDSMKKGTVQFVDFLGKRFEIRLFPYENSLIIPKNSYTKWYDYDKIRDAVVLRTRREGDFLMIHPQGKTKSLKSLLVDQKIPREERDKIPLVACDSHVLWAVGVRSSEAYRIDKDTNWVLSVTTDR